MNSEAIILHLATLGPLGYLVMPGTLTTLVTLPFVCMLSEYTAFHHALYFAIVIAIATCSFFIIQKALLIIKRHEDPEEIVLDDIIGCLLTFWMIPLTTESLVVGTLLFRCFSIPQWGLIKGSEELPGAWRIIADDVIAALVSNIILRFLF